MLSEELHGSMYNEASRYLTSDGICAIIDGDGVEQGRSEMLIHGCLWLRLIVAWEDQ